MKERFYANMEAGISENMGADFEPFTDIPVEQIAVDSLNGFELPISERELSELLNEAEALEIQPYEEIEPSDIEPFDPRQ